MKVLILVSCAIAAASAGWIPHEAKYNGPQHIPVIHNGVPVDTLEVQHAKSVHLAALAEASAKAGYTYEDDKYETEWKPAEVKYHGPLHYPVIHNGVPIDTPEVQHAKSAHLAAHSKAISHSGYQQEDYDHYNNNQGIVYEEPHFYTKNIVPVIGHDGKPLDTAEVEEAKAHHFAAVSKALELVKPYYGDHHYRYRRDLHAYPQHYAVIGHNGVPVEPLEVQQARAEHLASHAASAHSGVYGYSIHQTHAPVYGHHYSHYIPVIGHDGTPLDTPEVEHAKAAHFAAIHEATARNSIHNYEHNAQWNYNDEDYTKAPVDTIEVQHAKAAHFAAHAAARLHHF